MFFFSVCFISCPCYNLSQFFSFYFHFSDSFICFRFFFLFSLHQLFLVTSSYLLGSLPWSCWHEVLSLHLVWPSSVFLFPLYESLLLSLLYPFLLRTALSGPHIPPLLLFPLEISAHFIPLYLDFPSQFYCHSLLEIVSFLEIISFYNSILLKLFWDIDVVSQKCSPGRECFADGLQIFRGRSVHGYGFNEVAKQFCWDHASEWLLVFGFAAGLQSNFFGKYL